MSPARRVRRRSAIYVPRAGGGGGGGTAYTSKVLADTPLWYARLGDASGTTMVDSSGNARNGTYTGSPTLASTGLLVGDTDTAVVFGTSAKYAQVPYGSWMNVGTITLEALIKPSTVGSGYMSILDRDGYAGARSWQFRVTSAGKLEFLFWTTTAGPFTATGATTLVAGTTYHVAATYDGTTAKVYLNGVSDGTASASGTLQNTNTSCPLSVSINYEPGGGTPISQSFLGTIDEPAMYGTALSAAHISDHYVSVLGITDPRSISGLVAWYSAEAETEYADGDAMLCLHDQSGLGNHAAAFYPAVWKSSLGPSGGAAVYFGGAGQSFELPNVFTASSAGEIMAVVKSAAGNTALWGMGQNSNNGDESHYPYSGVVYESSGLPTGIRPSFADPGVTTAWHRYGVWSAPNDFDAHLDEVSKVTYTSAFTPYWNTAPLLGYGRSAGTRDMAFTGYVSAFVAFNRKLTTAERTALAAYFTAHPSGGVGTVSTTYTPDSYDTAVLATKPLAYWPCHDTSGNLYDAAQRGRTAVLQGSAPTYGVAATYGGTAITWPASTTPEYWAKPLALWAGANANLVSISAWVKVPTLAAKATVIGCSDVYGGGSADKYIWIDAAGKVNWSTYNSGSDNLASVSTLSAGTWYHIVGTIGAAGKKLYINGTLDASNGSTAAFSGATQYIMLHGGGSGFQDSDPITMNRIAVHNRQLTATEVSTIYAAR